MARAMVWLSGSVFLLWLAYRFGAWHLLIQLAIIAALFVWVIFVGYLIARGWHKHTPPPAPKSVENFAAEVTRVRAWYVAQYGETAANLAENSNPNIWYRMVGENWRAK